MRVHDAHWLATDAIAAAWGQALMVQSSIADVEAAIADDDLDTAVDAAWLCLFRIGFCLLLLDGYGGAASETEVLDALVADDHPILADLRSLRIAALSTEERVAQAGELIDRWDRALTEALPFQIPAIRTPRGFFPSVRMASQFEKLRSALGLPPFEWAHWNV